MGFLNPLVLAGLAAVSIPVLIHLLNKFRIRETRWAAMRFVQLSLQKNQKRIQFEDLLLLLLRCLVVALLVFAFARPALKTFVKSASTSGDGPVTAIVLLDNSASMGQSNGVQTRFEEARKSIEQWLGTLDSGSKVGFYLASNRADAVIAKPSPEFTLIRRGLELAEVTDRTTDWGRCLTSAYGILKDLPDSRREIHIYTDNQKTGWSGWDEIQKLQREYPGIAIRPHIIGSEGESNLAIIGLKTEGGVVAAKQTLRCRVDVANYGPAPAEGIRVTLSTDTNSPSDEALIPRIESGATQSLYLFVRFDVAGSHNITARIPPDRLPIDNQRSTALQVIDKIQALIVEGRTGGALAEQDGFFVTNALAPVSPDRAADYYLSPKTISFKTLAGTDTAPYELIVLCNVSETDTATSDKLRKYVEAGGSLILFPGTKTDPDKWRKEPGWGAWLPASWANAPKGDKESRPVKIQSENYSHPVTAIWNNPDQGSLGSVTLTNSLPLNIKKAAAPATQSPRVVLTTADGNPFLVEGSVGSGRVAVFGSSATPDWSNLPLHPGFVPLMQRLAGYLTGHEQSRLGLSPGEPFEWEVPMELLGRDFSISLPGSENEKRPGGKIELDHQRALLRYRDTDRSGTYRIYLGQDTQPLVVFAVQMNPAESDLRQWEPAMVEKLKMPPEVDTSAKTAPRIQVSREFWTALIWAVALLTLVEAALAHRFSPAI